MGIYSNILLQHTEIQNRISHSKKFLVDVKEAFSTFPSGTSSDVCVFAAGSLGRFEAGRKSDLDVFIIADKEQKKDPRSLTRLQEIELFSDLIRLNEKLELPAFSGDGRFLKVHELEDIIKATGDSRDDSENLFTTRLLLLLESQCISNDALYERALSKVLDNYFRDGKGRRDFQPLFLLNDILRYWRTLCLNYERDRALAKPWWKKNLNLKFSRKLMIFSTVLAIVSKQVKTADDFIQLSKNVPLERFANALDVINDPALEPKFDKLLSDYESFLAAKSYAELDVKDPEKLKELAQKADYFDSFIFESLHSRMLDQELVKYLAV
jgi:predicted nucleotidyltransferase